MFLKKSHPLVPFSLWTGENVAIVLAGAIDASMPRLMTGVRRVNEGIETRSEASGILN